MCHYARECTAPVHLSQGQRGDTSHACLQRTRGAEDRSPSERESHCKVQDDMPNLVILKVKSMTKRADSLRVLVDSGASNNFVRQQSLPLLDFKEKHGPRSQLEVRLATGAIVKTEKRVIRARFSYKHRVFVEELLVLDLDDKFDMVLGMPWLARHDPEIDWEKRTVVRFGRRGATESDGPVSAADTPNVTARGARKLKRLRDSERVSGKRPDTSRMFSATRRRGDNGVSTLGVDTRSVSESRKFSALWKLRHTTPPKGVEVTTKHRLQKSMRQVVWTVANVQH
ncbi:reverse transcriptase [Phytophthora megakarya]|uniref:Reverse transcriptase n=1 Tax=Phytophthora megakarya TaxID=4795 RepID=A0A225UE74_9STRA|nr:reverse transcriptase [Phytophthora megakarya]